MFMYHFCVLVGKQFFTKDVNKMTILFAIDSFPFFYISIDRQSNYDRFLEAPSHTDSDLSPNFEVSPIIEWGNANMNVH